MKRLLLFLLAIPAFAALTDWQTRLGPAYPILTDTRPTTFVTPALPFVGTNIPARVNPYQLGTPNADAGDYWSDSGQVAYVPDGSRPDDPGLMATRHFAYYRGVYATAPLPDVYRKPYPDPSTTNSAYITANGGPLANVLAQVRSTNTTGNDAFVLYENGFLCSASTQTGHGGNNPWPWFKFPANKRVQDLAVTSNNELALVALTDTDTGKGQLAVLMVEAHGIPFHTFSQMGLPNQASTSEFKLLGYVELPVSASLRVAAASNGFWGGPSATNGQTLGQLKLTEPNTLKNLYSGAWVGVVASAGYAVVSSRDESKIVVVDLSPLFRYIKESWLSSAEAFTATTLAKMEGRWPATFEAEPVNLPTIAAVKDLPRPVSVIAGHSIDRWSPDRYKFHVGLEAGELSIWDASPIMARFSYHRKGPALAEMGRVFVGENPICLAFTRRRETAVFGTLAVNGDGQNSVLWVACRKARQVVSVNTFGGKGIVTRTIEDSRLQDPVNVVACVRGPVILISDFGGKQVFGFRIGTITDTRSSPAKVYPPAEGKPWEISGILKLQGYPFAVTSENVN